MRKRWSDLLWLGSLPLLFACASARPLDPGAEPRLQPGEGVVVLQIRTEIPIEDLRFGGLVSTSAASKVPTGEHLLIVAIEEGSYRWTGLSFRTTTGHRVGGSLPPLDPLRFHVKPGHINYVGRLRIVGEVHPFYVRFGLGIENASGEAAPELARGLSPMLAHYPLVFGGWHRDDFVERYFARIGGSHPETPR